VLGVAILAVELLYLVAINVFLSTSLFEKVVDGDPATIDVRFARAWSLLPGSIHAERLSIRGRDSHVEWILRLDRVDFRVSFLGLLRKHFHVLSARGSGITFRLRQRVESPRATPEYVAKLPAIAGLPTLAFAPDEPPGKDVWSDADYHLWTVDLEDLIAARVREIWIDTARFDGLARIAGGFYLKPIRTVAVGPVHVDVAPGGHVAVAGQSTAEQLSGSFVFTLSALDPRVAKGTDVLHHASLATDLRTNLPDLGGLRLWPDDMHVHGRVEARRVALRVKDGVVRDDTHVEVRGASLSATFAGHEVVGATAITGNVIDRRFEFCVEATDLGARDFMKVHHVTACGDSAALDLARPLTDLHALVDAAEVELPDARVLDPYVPSGTPVRVVSGRAQAALHVEVWVAEKRATGRATLNTNDLDLQVAKVRARGATTANASFGSWSWETRHASDAHVAIRVDNASIATVDAPTRTFVRVESLSLDAQGKDIDVADPLRSFHAAIRMPGGEVIDQVFLRAYLPEGDEMHIEHGQTHFDARCDVDVKDHRAAGTLEVRADRVALAFRDLHVVADVFAHGMVHDWDWPRGDLAVDAARVDLRNIGVAHVSSAAAVTIAHVGVAVSSPRFSFSDPLARARLAVAIEDGKVNDPTAIDEFLPRGSTFAFVSDAGSFDVHLAADVTKHVAAGKLAVVARAMGIAGEKLLVAGDVGIDAAVERWDLDRQTIGVEAAEVTVDHVRGALDRAAKTADFTADRIALTVSAGSFDLAHPSLRGVDYRLRVARADLQDARVFNALLPREKIFAVESGSAQVSADVALSPSRRTGEGQVHVTLRDAAVRFQASHFAGQFAVDARVAGFDPEHSAVDLAGSRLWMRDVRVTGASTSTSAWQGNVLLRAGTLRFDPAPAMNGTLTIDARDASPVLAILLGDSLPRFLVGLTDMPRLRGSAQLDLAPGLLVLSSLDARGGDIAVRGAYVVRDDHRHGAFVIDKGLFSAGLLVADDGAHLHFFGLEGWLRDETGAAMRAAACPAAVGATGLTEAMPPPSYCLALPR
jgi:hypothetical protein